MSVTHTTAVRTALADAVCNSSTGLVGANGRLVIYSGTPVTGTVTATNGSAAVTGAGTGFTTQVSAGQAIQFAGDTTNRVYTVSAVNSDTSLTLTANYAGTTTSGAGARTAPINAQAALNSNTAVATITGLNFGAAAAGVSTVTGSTQDGAAVGGTAMFFRLTTTAGTAIFQGLCGTSGADLVLNTMTVGAGSVVSLTGTNTYTAPA